ncbi:SRPBCC family protein [Litorivivens sp.]|uniref:SRPBCC family protein n=1 Tax=Litorivivens sp. TaxID=2020868 RepID=UPI003567CE1D
MFECTAVDLTFLETARNCYKASVDINATPEQIFESFEDAEDWTRWAPPIQKVEWTSPKPFGLGTTRTVSMSGGMVGDEVFIAWDYPKRMAFCFTACSKPMTESFAEDYVVTPLDNGMTRVEWTMAMEVKGAGRITLPLFSPFMKIGVKWMLKRFKKLVEAKALAVTSQTANGR